MKKNVVVLFLFLIHSFLYSEIIPQPASKNSQVSNTVNFEDLKMQSKELYEHLSAGRDSSKASLKALSERFETFHQRKVAGDNFFFVQKQKREKMDKAGAGFTAAAVASIGLAVGMYYLSDYLYGQYNAAVDTDSAVMYRKSTNAADSFMIISGVNSLIFTGLAVYSFADGPDRAIIGESNIIFLKRYNSCLLRGY
jgi:hypothetical protein